MEIKDYIFTTDDGREITVAQSQLKLKQELAIVKLFTDLEIQTPEDLLQISLKDLIGILADEDKVYEFLSIFLKGDYEKKDLGEISHDLLEDIYNDFLSFNKKLRQRLKSLSAGIGSVLTSLVQERLHSQPSVSSTPSPKATSRKDSKSSKQRETKPSAG